MTQMEQFFLANPIGGQDDELVPVSEPSEGNLRHRDQTKVLEAKIAESSSHGQARGINIRQPNPRHLWLIPKSKDSAPAPSDPLCLSWVNQEIKISQRASSVMSSIQLSGY